MVQAAPLNWLTGDSRWWARRMAAWFALVWTMALAMSLVLIVRHHREEVLEFARSEARANIDKDLAYRLWATSHGGVYVPVDEVTQPNPYLQRIPERDIVTPSGRRLTLMNPAFVLRQTMGMYGDLFGVRGHITSLQLTNPINAPDAWEEQALRRFQAGERLVTDEALIDGKPHLRMIRAMLMEEGCLKCHADTGLKVGDVRGGISVAVPLERYEAAAARATLTDVAVCSVLWLVGLLAIAAFARRLSRLAEQRDAAQRVLALSEERYRRMIETAREGIWVLDRDGVTVYANAVLADMLGVASDQLVGRPLRDFLAVDNPPGAAEALAAAGTDPRRVEMRLQRQDSGPFEAIVSAAPLADVGGERLLCMVTDISGLKRGEQRLLELVDQLSASNDELDRFAQLAAHDLREPIRSIISFSQLLERKCEGQLDAEGRDFLTYLMAGAHRMHDLIGDLADYSRLKAGGAFRVVDGRRVAADAIDNLHAAVAESGAQIEVGDLPPIHADPPQAVRLLQNLIANAIMFHRPGVPPRIRIDANAAGAQVEFVVADNGIGIDPAYHEQVFGLFRRLHAGNAYPGTGIGLATCRRIVERHGGRIWVDSRPGEGARFHFTLPAAL